MLFASSLRKLFEYIVLIIMLINTLIIISIINKIIKIMIRRQDGK